MQSGSRHVIARRSRTSHVCVYHTVVPLTTAVQLCLQVHTMYTVEEERGTDREKLWRTSATSKERTHMPLTTTAREVVREGHADGVRALQTNLEIYERICS